MSAVVPVGPEDFDAVHEAILAADVPDVSRESWSRLFAWGDPDEPRGWAIVHGERVVGFLGTVTRRRATPGGSVAFCNLHSWIVDPAHRGRSLFLLRRALEREDAVLTDFSPTPEVEAIEARLGFQRLDARLRILLRTTGRDEPAEVDLDAGRVAERLDPEAAAALADHDGLRHAWVEDARGGGWVAFSVVDRYPVRHCLVHHLGDPASFARASRAARRAMTGASDARFVAVPERLLGGRPLPWSVTLPAASRQLVRAPRPPGIPVDTLWSEVAALGLATMPDLSQSATEGARNLLPWKGRTDRPRD